MVKLKHHVQVMLKIFNVDATIAKMKQIFILRHFKSSGTFQDSEKENKYDREIFCESIAIDNKTFSFLKVLYCQL